MGGGGRVCGANPPSATLLTVKRRRREGGVPAKVAAILASPLPAACGLAGVEANTSCPQSAAIVLPLQTLLQRLLEKQTCLLPRALQ